MSALWRGPACRCAPNGRSPVGAGLRDPPSHTGWWWRVVVVGLVVGTNVRDRRSPGPGRRSRSGGARPVIAERSTTQHRWTQLDGRRDAVIDCGRRLGVRDAARGAAAPALGGDATRGGDPRRDPRRPGRGRARAGDRRRLAAGPRRPGRRLARDRRQDLDARSRRSLTGPFTAGVALGGSVEPWRRWIARPRRRGLPDRRGRRARRRRDRRRRRGAGAVPRPQRAAGGRLVGHPPLPGDHRRRRRRGRHRDDPGRPVFEPRGRPDRRPRQLAPRPRRPARARHRLRGAATRPRGATTRRRCCSGPSSYAAASGGRGIERVGPATASGRSPRSRGRRSVRKLARIAEAVRIAGPARRRSGSRPSTRGRSTSGAPRSAATTRPRSGRPDPDPRPAEFRAATVPPSRHLVDLAPRRREDPDAPGVRGHLAPRRRAGGGRARGRTHRS